MDSVGDTNGRRYDDLTGINSLLFAPERKGMYILYHVLEVSSWLCDLLNT